jgi:peptide-methionine (R)-S-oxide reductase
MITKIYKTESEWKKLLSPEQYSVMRQKQTEKPFTCELTQYKGEGNYLCVACELPLFKSSGKFESGTGWPSFYEPVSPDHLLYREDRSSGTTRTEVLCASCESHLGHVFPDGPPPAGLRYCINGITLKFNKIEI